MQHGPMPKPRVSMHLDPDTCTSLDEIVEEFRRTTGAKISRVEAVRMLVLRHQQAALVPDRAA